MSRAARAPTPAPPPPNPPPSKPIVPPINRHLAFVTTKPHFVPSDDYHRFSNTGRAADQEPGAIVVRPPVRTVSSIFVVDGISATKSLVQFGKGRRGNSPHRGDKGSGDVYRLLGPTWSSVDEYNRPENVAQHSFRDQPHESYDRPH